LIMAGSPDFGVSLVAVVGRARSSSASETAGGATCDDASCAADEWVIGCESASGNTGAVETGATDGGDDNSAGRRCAGALTGAGAAVASGAGAKLRLGATGGLDVFVLSHVSLAGRGCGGAVAPALGGAGGVTHGCPVALP